MNVEELQEFCVANVRCDFCGNTGGTFEPSLEKFLCDNDRRLVNRMKTLAQEERENPQN